jgi:hypothetical protein
LTFPACDRLKFCQVANLPFAGKNGKMLLLYSGGKKTAKAVR